MCKREKNLANNLVYLRKLHQLTLEQVAEKIKVSRQAISKWEAAETIPDLNNCLLLAELYNVTLDDLVYFDGKNQSVGIAPRGQHLFGITVLGEHGQLVIPKEARELFRLKAGDKLVVLGDENSQIPGIAILAADLFMKETKNYLDLFYPGRKRDE